MYNWKEESRKQVQEDAFLISIRSVYLASLQQFSGIKRPCYLDGIMTVKCPHYLTSEDSTFVSSKERNYFGSVQQARDCKGHRWIQYLCFLLVFCRSAILFCLWDLTSSLHSYLVQQMVFSYDFLYCGIKAIQVKIFRAYLCKY